MISNSMRAMCKEREFLKEGITKYKDGSWIVRVKNKFTNKLCSIKKVNTKEEAEKIYNKNKDNYNGTIIE